ncbi:MAG: GH92 family glycosyl hydrolase [Bacteroidales bacterium]|nr:GH92 family glycosyl hydrolase [Bacteroidales bacterium]
MKKFFIAIIALATVVSCTEDYTQYVDPFIGTAYTGHTYPAATTPFAMVQVGPDTGTDGWRFCSGYHDSSSSIIGFSHTHLNGTGCADMGDILLMPLVNCSSWDAGSDENPDSGYRSGFSTETETAGVDYYKVYLEDYGITAEMTATSRVAIHRYTFPSSENAAVLIDLEHGLDSRTTESFIKIIDDCTVVGKRRSTGFVYDHWYYFCAKFDKPFGEPVFCEGKEDLKVKLPFVTEDGEQIKVKVALSTVSEEGAVANMEAELPGWDFEKTRAAGAKAWKDLLGRMEISDPNHDKMVAAYTSLYHSLLMPNLITDVDGSYTGWDHEIHKNAPGEDMYTNFSLWDTYRAEHSLLNLLYPEINVRLVNSLLEKYRQTGLLCTNEYGICETWCMIGNHAVPVVVDAVLKGLDIDKDLAYEACKASLTTDHPKSSFDVLDKYGYYPVSFCNESVSRTLEHCYDDWCMKVLADLLDKPEDAAYFAGRADFYKNLFDPETCLMRPRNEDGSWLSPFDPQAVSHDSLTGGAYTEGTAWQYTWHVQHDVQGLIGLFPSKDAFVAQLSRLFDEDNVVKGDVEVPDVTGLIGQYAHGNEPSHHIAYMLSMAGVPDMTAEIVRKVFDRFYMAKRDGLCGNDDCGQMSSWYLFSGMGFYPVDPVSGEYVFGAPQFPEMVLHLPNGKDFTIKANGLCEENKFVKTVSYNGIDIPYTSISFDDICKGGVLEYEMKN